MSNSRGHSQVFYCMEAERVSFHASKEHRIRDEVRNVFRNEGQEELKIPRGITRNRGLR